MSASHAGPAAAHGNAVGILDDDPSRIRVFDFSRQETIERGRLRLLRPMFDTLGGRVASALTSQVRQIVRVTIADEFNQASWEEFAPSLPDPTYVSTALVLPFERRFVLHLPVPLAHLLLDHFLGGDGRSQPERDTLSALEISLLAPIVEELWGESIIPALSSFLELGVASVQSVDSPIFLQVGRPGEICLFAEIELSVADSGSFTLSLALPVSAVTSIIESVERAHSGVTADANSTTLAQVERGLQSVPVELKVSYPPVRFTPAELADLQAGDVLPLRPRAEDGFELLELVVGDAVVGHGVLVEDGRNLAVTVTEIEEVSL